MKPNVDSTNSSKGFTYIIIAALLFGIAGAFSKILFNNNISPVDLTAIRTIIACLIFAIFLFITNKKSFYFNKNNIMLLIFSGVIFTIINTTFYMAISLINVAAAITLEYIAPLFVIIINFTIFNKKINSKMFFQS
ncbi:MAG: hypothetical protein CR991_02595 [Proteobacteria bacterium]|nr:MAG: hypothetical protein CR991_02595 [Pseudomonadota bacterium]